jgi:hypothetical protein
MHALMHLRRPPVATLCLPLISRTLRVLLVRAAFRTFRCPFLKVDKALLAHSPLLRSRLCQLRLQLFWLQAALCMSRRSGL